jgi:hypothetical protein
LEDHCGRGINKVAHEIARYFNNSQDSCNYVDEPLALFLQTLLNDKNIIYSKQS